MYVLTILYILPLQIDIKNDGNVRVGFSILCLKSLINIILFSSSSIFTIVWIISHSLYYEEYFTKAFNSVYAPSDVWIMVGFLNVCCFAPLFVVTFLSSNIWSKMKEVTREPNIPFPKAYLAIFVSTFLELCSMILIFFANYLATYPLMNKYSTFDNLLNTFVVPLIPAEVNLINQILFALLMFALIERMTYLIRTVQSFEDDIKKKIELFKKFQKLMNVPILCLVFFSQIMWIVTMFFSFGLFVGTSKLETLPLILSMMGYLFYSIAFLGFLKDLFFKLNELNDSRACLREAVEDLINIDDNRRRFLLRDVERLKPVSGYGLFSVERSTLTSMVSVAITYLIILIQFKMAVT